MWQTSCTAFLFCLKHLPVTHLLYRKQMYFCSVCVSSAAMLFWTNIRFRVEFKFYFVFPLDSFFPHNFIFPLFYFICFGWWFDSGVNEKLLRLWSVTVLFSMLLMLISLWWWFAVFTHICAHTHTPLLTVDDKVINNRRSVNQAVNGFCQSWRHVQVQCLMHHIPCPHCGAVKM